MASSRNTPPTSKKAKLYRSRIIRTESLEPALRNGVLNASEFISSREFEIRAFEQSQLNTKSVSSSRIFQNLPRTLRRRTASHNVKRIPKRLHSRALREMNSSGLSTRTKKRVTGREIYRLRMKKKLLRMAARLRELKMPPAVTTGSLRDRFQGLNAQLKNATLRPHATLNNAAGAFDRVGVNELCERPRGGVKFGNRQRTFTWLPNDIWHAKRFHMFKRWGYQIPLSPNQKCFRATSRAAKEAALAFETSHYGNLIIQCKDAVSARLALQEFTVYSGDVPKWLLEGQKAYSGWFYVAGAHAALVSAYYSPLSRSIMIRFHPADFEHCFEAVRLWAEPKDGILALDCRFALGSIELHGPKALFCLSKVLHISKPNEKHHDWKVCSQGLDPNLLPVGTVFAFFVKDPRYWKHTVQPPPVRGNIKNLAANGVNGMENEAVSALFLPEGRTDAYKDFQTVKLIEQERSRRDPSSTHVHGSSKFPILIYKTRTGAWCATMPWFWVQPLWSMLMKITDLKVGGYRQTHQLNAEALQPTYPYDYPFMLAGYQDHMLNTQTIKLADEKLPASKRICYQKTEGELSPGCDWFFLQKWRMGLLLLRLGNPEKYLFGEFDAEHNRVLRNLEDLALIINATRGKTNNAIPIAALDMSDEVHRSFVAGKFKPDISKFPRLPVVQVTLRPVKNGLVKDSARVYSESTGSNESLVGFITTAAFNLTIGQPSAIAVISAQCKDLETLFLRNVGCTTVYAARVSLL